MRNGTSPEKLILLVEDDDDNAEVLTLIITQEAPWNASCQVVWAKNEHEAESLIQEGRPDLLILEDAFPSMPAIEIYDCLRKRPGWETVPALVLSTGLPNEIIANHHLPCVEKPFEMDELLSVLRSLLEL